MLTSTCLAIRYCQTLAFALTSLDVQSWWIKIFAEHPENICRLSGIFRKHWPLKMAEENLLGFVWGHLFQDSLYKSMHVSFGDSYKRDNIIGLGDTERKRLNKKKSCSNLKIMLRTLMCIPWSSLDCCILGHSSLTSTFDLFGVAENPLHLYVPKQGPICMISTMLSF